MCYMFSRVYDVFNLRNNAVIFLLVFLCTAANFLALLSSNLQQVEFQSQNLSICIGNDRGFPCRCLSFGKRLLIISCRICGEIPSDLSICDIGKKTVIKL